ncbi:oligoendopeptidase F [[Mycoplasma] mobile]|uniref:Oligopeptidase F n=1 Tax=Mycoplasma mobile (strain ATCC 43663 / 163K / NCTC 11711) TaxID=267748 RepID=Q6KI91_MYCM1|nr:oligoendopeptidase F [[Mycoplasma] mobile]AAT27685.1 oligoendopeptidase f [Mycoplasma mobile 163K]
MEIKNYKKYEDVPKEYRFDLEVLLEGKKIENLLETFFVKYEELITEKDSKYESIESYVKNIEKSEKASILFNKISNYISNNISTNFVNPKFNKMYQELQFKFYELNKKLGNEENRIFKNESKLRNWLKDKRLKNHQKSLEFILESKKHKLEDEIEEFLTKTSRADINADEVFSILNNSELDYGFAISKDGKKTKISVANRAKLLKNSDESIRKTTTINWLNASIKHKQTFANLLFQHFKNVSTWAQLRNYPSAVESIIQEDKADIILLETLYSQVQKAIPIFQKYDFWKKKFFKKNFNKKMERWDHQLPLVKVKNEYSVKEANELVIKAVEPFGKEYLDKVKEAFNSNWVDYMPVENKRSGAYSIGQSFGLDKKYILMNFDGSLRSVATLAHEMGHSLHSYFSDKYQPYSLSSYPIFLAEIASIFNELMLQDYLLKQNPSDKFKFSLLSNSIEDFEATVRRQTMWSNYEFDLYNAIDKGEPKSNFEAISEVYRNNALKYSLDKTVKYKEDHELIASVIVPHFYYDFYVYKYAIGYIVANVFFQRYKKHGKEKLQEYIDKFLKSGGRDWPILILKDAGVDLYDEKIYQEAFVVLEKKIDEYIKIGKKLWK